MVHRASSRARGVGVITLTLLALAPGSSGDVVFRGLGTLEPGLSSFVRGISPDGAVVVGMAMHRLPDGSSANRPVRWAGTGIEVLPGFENGQVYSGQAHAASLGGGVIVGGGTYLPGFQGRAFRTLGNLTQVLPNNPDDGFTTAWDVTPDGARIVGRSGGLPVVWQGGAGPTAAPLPAGAVGGTAIGIAADGSRIAATAYTTGSDSFTYLWSSADGIQEIPIPDGYHRGYTQGISDDGGTVLHRAQRVVDGGFDAFVWSQAGGTMMLPGLPGSVSTIATAVSADGSTIVGSSNVLGERALLWRDGEAVDLNQWLPTLGIDLTGWTLFEATAVSADGLVIAGQGRHVVDGQIWTEAWVVTIPGPGAGGVVLLGAFAAGQYGGRRRRKP